MLREHIGIEPAMEINPDEAVALGAAVQSAIINGEKVNAMLIDVAPHSLGIAVAKVMFEQLMPGIFSPIIHRNTTIPTTKSEHFYTISPGQDTVEIEVFQGESQVATENNLLGKFKLTDIPPNPDPEKSREVIVEFSYNLNGIVEVVARDRRGDRREMLSVSTATTKRKTSDPEVRKRFDSKLERDIKRALDSSATLALSLDADGEKKDAERLRQARLALEEALEAESEKRVMDKLNDLDEILYELEE
jgi:molecular chaperone DnaK